MTEKTIKKVTVNVEKVDKESKGFVNVPLKKKGKKASGDNAVENIPIEKVGDKMVSNCGETSIFMGRLMHEKKVSTDTVIINAIDCGYAINISPEDLWDFIAEHTNMLIGVWPDKLMKKWGKAGTSYVHPNTDIGFPLGETKTESDVEPDTEIGKAIIAE